MAAAGLLVGNFGADRWLSLTNPGDGGAIGIAATAENLLKLGCKVTGVTRSGTARTKLDRIATLDELGGILKETDILVSTLPATPETEGLIGRKRIKLLPKGRATVRAEFPDGKVPLTKGEPGTAGDVAGLVRFLLSDESSHITGTPIWIDGGQSLLV